jgi:protein-tyrosine phosphatase
MRICFVCLGNICRSPAAAAVLRSVAVDHPDVEITVESAGTADYHVGEDAHAHTRAVADARGIPLRHSARQFRPADFVRFDLVVAMDRANERDLRRLARSAEERTKVVRLGEFASDAARAGGRDVADPWGQPQTAYEAMFDQLDDACRGLIAYAAGRVGGR